MKYKFSGNLVDTKERVYGDYYFKAPLTVENYYESEDGLFFLSGGKTKHCISNDDGLVYVVDEDSLKIEMVKEQ